MKLYRVKYINGRFGPMWYANPVPGINPIHYPVIVGVDTLEQCMDRVYDQMRKTRANLTREHRGRTHANR